MHGIFHPVIPPTPPAKKVLCAIALVFALLVTLVICLGGCRQHPRATTTQAHRKVLQVFQAPVYHLHDGRYTYQSDDGLWWYYMASSQQNNTFVTTQNYEVKSYGVPTSLRTVSTPSYSLPKGGSWSSGSQPTARELDKAEKEPVNLEKDEQNQPATPEEVAAEQAAQVNGEPAQPENNQTQLEQVPQPDAQTGPQPDTGRPVEPETQVAPAEPEAPVAPPAEPAAEPAADSNSDSGSSGGDSGSSGGDSGGGGSD